MYIYKVLIPIDRYLHLFVGVNYIWTLWFVAQIYNSEWNKITFKKKYGKTNKIHRFIINLYLYNQHVMMFSNNIFITVYFITPSLHAITKYILPFLSQRPYKLLFASSYNFFLIKHVFFCILKWVMTHFLENKIKTNRNDINFLLLPFSYSP